MDDLEKVWEIIVTRMKDSDINDVLKMIYDLLLFDDYSGIFPKAFVLDEREQLNFTYIWLLNELLLIVANDKHRTYADNNLKLQKEMISAASMRQPWWVRKAIRLYGEVLSQLDSFDRVTPDSSIEVTLSPVESYQMKLTVLKFEKIKIDNLTAYHELKLCCIHVLSHAVFMVDRDSLVEEATEHIFKCLETDDISLKCFSLKYFVQLLKSAIEPDKIDRELHFRIVNTIFHIYNDLPFWIANNDVNERDNARFNKGVSSYLLDVDELNIEFTQEESRQQLQILMKITELFFKHHFIITMDVMQQIFKFIKKCFDSGGNFPNVLDKMIEFLPNTQQAPAFIHVYESFLLYEVQTCSNFTGILYESSKIWRHFCDLLVKKLSDSTKILQSEKLLDNLIIVQDILKLLNNFEYKFLKWHQLEHAKDDQHCFCVRLETGELNLSHLGLKYFNFECGELVERIVAIISSIVDLNLEIVMIATSISFALLKNSFISEKIEPQRKSALMSIIVSPIYKQLASSSTKLDFQVQGIFDKIPKNIKSFLENEEIPEIVEKRLVSRFLELTSNLNMAELLPSFLSLHLFVIDFVLNSSDAERKQGLIDCFINCLVFNMENSSLYLMKFLELVNSKSVDQLPLILSVLGDCLCLCSKNCQVLYEKNDQKSVIKIECFSCNGNKISPASPSANKPYKISLSKFQDFNLPVKLDESYFNTDNVSSKCQLLEFLPTYLTHQPKTKPFDLWVRLLLDQNEEVLSYLEKNLSEIVKRSELLSTTEKDLEDFHQLCLKTLLKMTVDNMESEDQKNQKLTINIISNFAEAVDDEEVLMHCFRMMIYYMMSFESLVKDESVLLAIDMCQRRNLTPLNLLNWYKQRILAVIVSLSVYNYSVDHSLQTSLEVIQMCFDDLSSTEFLYKYYQDFVAILLPFCMKDSRYFGLLDEVVNILQHDLATILDTSFLKIFPNVYINEEAEINNACIDFVLENTGSTMLDLLEQNVKKTVAECLLYYHKSPDFVMKALDSLTSNGTKKCTAADAAEFIAGKFLGVLIYFESMLTNSEVEKSVKSDFLLSLGCIIRLLGAQHLTNFQFKIMAVLKVAYTITDVDLKEICLQVWKIFILTADVTTLGPILSTIFVSLEPFLENYPIEVNEIYKYLVIDNENLLSLHVPDLFFVDGISINPDIKKAIQGQIRRQRNNENFLEKFQTFLDYANHEDSGVRIHGLKYFKKLLEKNRKALKDMIVGQISINPMIEVLLDILMKNCKSENPGLQLIAAEVLGEIGAIEPGLLPPNYAKVNSITSFTIDSNEFAAKALSELCKAYQFQSNSKFLDAYSLGIQEILKLRNVDPIKKVNMDVWSVVPERMSHFVIPLLTSTYTPIILFKKHMHPIFGQTSSCIEWGYNWASKLIRKVSDVRIKHFLESINSSMKWEMHLGALFLPYILIHSIECSNANDLQEIYEEFTLIFKFVYRSKDVEMLPPTQRVSSMKHFTFFPKKIKNRMVESEIVTATKCSKLIFGIFDFLESFLRSSQGDPSNQLYADIDTLLNKFDNKLLAQVNYKCKEFARALIYLEAYIKEDPAVRLQEELTFLGNIYAELGDVDSVEGLKHVKKNELSLTEQILINNVTGKLHESAACYERMLQIGVYEVNDIKKMVSCYVGMDQPETALMMSESAMKELLDDDVENFLQEMKAEPLWRLGMFEELEQLLDNTDASKPESWGMKCGKLFLKLRKMDFAGFSTEVQTARQDILNILRASESQEGAYFKDYPEIIKIHLIDEFEKAEECVEKIKNTPNVEFAEKNLQALIDHWNDRLVFLQPTPAIVEPILCIRRILMSETKNILKNVFTGESFQRLDALLNAEIGKLWIKSTRYSCKNKTFQQAHLYILNADTYQPKELFLEKAKYYWQKGDQINAIKVLDRGTRELIGYNENDEISPRTVSALSGEDRKLYGKGKRLIATMNAEAGHVGSDKNKEMFREALEAYKECEKTPLLYAAYLDKIFASTTFTDNESYARLQSLYEIMRLYGQSMLYGCDYVYQSMPRFLTVWLDNTTVVKIDRRTKDFYDKMNKLVDLICQQIQPYFFLTAFSQISSRIGHPNPEVYNTLKNIIIKIMLNYTQQSLWMLQSIYRSSYTIRVKRCNEIFSDKRLNDPGTQRLIKDFNTMTEKFLKLTSAEVRGNHSKVSQIVPDFPQLFKKDRFSNIILPIQKNLTLVRDCSKKCFTFPTTFVYLRGIEENVDLLKSLQRPKKVKLMGSDGKSYIMLLKHKDDLRKDYRFMEFNAVVREYLCKDPEARHRKLNVRTYAVNPMNEESGIIEWVSNLRTFKEILCDQYDKCGIKIPSLGQVRDMEMEKMPVDRRRKRFLELVQLHAPVFDNWFREQFSNPHNYFQARSAYIKSTAVMSMIGYMMGLGDRHGENIMFDEASGDTVHVDFNCLFNRGESLAVPEVVPFRLTHNMVNAMGPLGLDGPFRKCCEITLRILQKESNTLMSFLRPFVYDPLVSWERQIDSSNRDSERTDRNATKYVNEIEKRLKGIVKKFRGSSNIPLSIEGQVNVMIEEATNIDSLASMFYGWSSYM